MNVTLYEGDSREVLKGMIERGEYVHSVVCDPPYGLVSVTKRFGKDNAKPAKYGSDGLFARQSRGFMGQTWDGTAIERDPEFWKLVYAVMLPGAYIVAFSSSRTYGHMQVAMEQAGFVTHPMIGWVFNQGFPKAHAADKAIDKTLGRKGNVEATGNPVRRIRPDADQNNDGTWEKLADRTYQPGQYVPATEEAAQWQGYSYGTQARKPALEPIYVGQKPFREKNGALNILRYGVGAVNIDGCRVPTDEDRTRANSGSKGKGGVYGDSEKYTNHSNPLGRWPANLIHDGSPEVVGLFPESKGQQGDVRGTEKSRTGDENTNCYGEYGRVPSPKRADQSGSSARFFESYTYLCAECCDSGWIGEGDGSHGNSWQAACPSCLGQCLDGSPFDGQPFFHHAKAGKKDRAGSRHGTVKPIPLIASLVRHVTPPGGRVLDPFAGSGTTGKAAIDEGMEPVLIEKEAEYCRDIRRRLNLPEPIDPMFVDLLGGPSPTNSTDSRSLQFEELLG